MAAQRRPHRQHRRWFVRRRRFLDAQGRQVTNTRLNVPFLPRRILSYRTPDGHPGAGHVYFDVPPAGCDAVVGGLVVVLLVVSIVYDVATGQLVARIPDYLMLLGALGILTFLRWRLTGRPG